MNHNLKLELTKEILKASELLQKIIPRYDEFKEIVDQYIFNDELEIDFDTEECSQMIDDFATLLADSTMQSHFIRTCYPIFNAEPLFASVATKCPVIQSEHGEWVSHIYMGHTSNHLLFFSSVYSLSSIWDSCSKSINSENSQDNKTILWEQFRKINIKLPTINAKPLYGALRSEYMKLIAIHGCPPGYQSTNQDGFNTLMLTFTEGENKIFFDSAKTQFQLFQYVYHRRACSFDELRKQVWKSETKDSNIISCVKRVNQKIECAGLLDRYDLQTKNGHVVLNGPR